jgi:hypothetical protein
MPTDPQVSDEAVEALAERDPNWAGCVEALANPDRYPETLGAWRSRQEKICARARADLEAAAPAIRNQERQRIREALIEQLGREAPDNDYDCDHIGAVEDAFAALEDSKEVGGR